MVTGILLPRVQLLRIPMVVGEILIGIVCKQRTFIITESHIPTATRNQGSPASQNGFHAQIEASLLL